MTLDTVRLDKWLWYARFYKSRSLAAKLCKSGKVRVNSTVVKKSHHHIRLGDILTFPLGNRIRVIRIEGLTSRRGPPTKARELFEDLNPQVENELNPKENVSEVSAKRDPGSGRPTKLQRRALDRLRGWFGGR